MMMIMMMGEEGGEEREDGSNKHIAHYLVLNSFPSALQGLTYLILITRLQGRYCYPPH